MKQHNEEFDFEYVRDALLSWMDTFDIEFRTREALEGAWYEINGGVSVFEDDDERSGFDQSETFKHLVSIFDQLKNMKEN